MVLILTLTLDRLEFLSETKVENFDVATNVEANNNVLPNHMRIRKK